MHERDDPLKLGAGAAAINRTSVHTTAGSVTKLSQFRGHKYWEQCYRARPVRLLGLAAALFAAFAGVGLAAPGAARAGAFEVVACDYAPGGSNNSWRLHTVGMAVIAACPSDNADRRGLVTRSPLGGLTPALSVASFTFDAPPGTSLTQMRATLLGHRSRSIGWGAGVRTPENTLGRYRVGANSGTGNPDESFGGGPRGAPTTIPLGGSGQVSFETLCGGTACDSSATSASMRVYGAAVTVNDPVGPAVGPTGGTIGSRPVQRGPATISFGASDNVGIHASRLTIDGGLRSANDQSYPCDYTRQVPCANQPALTQGFDTRGLSDAAHTATVTVVDAGGNEASFTREFQVDNRPRLEDGAKITLGVGPKTIRNGQRAGFRGRVTGGGEPVPDVIVALEARVGRRWVNFRTLRSGPAGIFETLYRFTRTYRTRTYRFRARIVSQKGSEAGNVVSRGGRVKVFGRRLRRS